MSGTEDFDDADDDRPAIAAATLVIFRSSRKDGPPEILMVERSATMVFAGGAAVFPGGRVDPADLDLASELGALDEEHRHELAARIAAVRETLEETGLVVGIEGQPSHGDAIRARALLLDQKALGPVLREMGWTIDLGSLLPFARWRPKHRHMRVYDTRFYLADLGTGAVDLLVDESENTHLFWASAADALHLADTGKIKIIFPTRRNLERLAQFGSFDDAASHVGEYPSRMITPFMEDRDGVRWLVIPGDAGYPVDGEPLESADRA